MTVPGSIDALLLGGQGSYQIERSLRFNSADSAYLDRTFASAGNLQTWTLSFWVKRSALAEQRLFSVPDSSGHATLRFGSTDALEWSTLSTSSNGLATTNAVFRDLSAWYHIVFAFNTTLATAADRIILYVNNTRQALASSTNPTQNANGSANGAVTHYIGKQSNASSYFNGYLTEIHFVGGQALTPSSFGETNPVTGVWRPKKYSGTYGTNGFYLKFADNSGTTSTTLGKDSSGNGNNWTPNNFSVTAGIGNDSLIDTPTPYADGGNGRGNYATWNPVAGNMPISNGALYAYNPYAYYPAAFGTIKISANFSPIYWEGIVDSGTGQSSGMVWGLTAGDSSVTGAGIYGAFTDGGNSLVYSSNGGTLFYPGGVTAGTILQFAFNPSTGNIWLGKNNVWYNSSGGSTGNPATGANPTTTITGTALTPYVQAYANGLNVNFGQRAFAYTPPSGFLALNTQNLPEPTVQKPNNYMDVVTYTGTGASLTPTSSLGFSPDFVWIKGRSGATDHAIYDAVRGVQLDLVSNSTAAETTQSQGLTAFNSNGFTIGTLAKLNTSTAAYAAWCWDESATPGFDIVAFTAQATAATVAHSLGVAPKFIIMKDRDTAAYPWLIYHADVGIQKYLQFSTAGSTTASTAFSTAPTSTVFDPGTGVTTGNGYNRLVAYLWSEVAGFSKFGSYTGNGSSDGPFVFCGFKPRWLMIKRSDSAESWLITDTAREIFNPTDDVLWANLSNSEAANYTPQDVLSNGFKIRTSSTSTNASGGTYIFAAFAESPFKYSLAC